MSRCLQQCAYVDRFGVSRNYHCVGLHLPNITPRDDLPVERTNKLLDASRAIQNLSQDLKVEDRKVKLRWAYCSDAYFDCMYISPPAILPTILLDLHNLVWWFIVTEPLLSFTNQYWSPLSSLNGE